MCVLQGELGTVSESGRCWLTCTVTLCFSVLPHMSSHFFISPVTFAPPFLLSHFSVAAPTIIFLLSLVILSVLIPPSSSDISLYPSFRCHVKRVNFSFILPPSSQTHSFHHLSFCNLHFEGYIYVMFNQLDTIC